MDIPHCPVLKPSWKQFQHFQAYVEEIEQKYKSHFGMVKVVPFQVVPPPEWTSIFSDYSLKLQQLTVTSPIEQNVSGKGGLYQCLHIPKKSMTLADYRHKTVVFDRITTGRSSQEVQDMFWKNIVFSPPLYGADLVSSLMDQRCGEWNLNRLNSLLRLAVPKDIKGVTTSYCYVGSWKALFCWHKEDLDLSAINYLHQGKSKFWYSIPEEQGQLLEKEAMKHFPEHFSRCSEHLRHKTTLINPYLLKRKIPELRISKAEHRPGEFMLVLGGSYHCGFNFGYNIAEAINYATLSWLSRLPNAKPCKCQAQSVRVDPRSVLDNLALTPFAKTQQYSQLKRVVEGMEEKQRERSEVQDLKFELSRKIRKDKKVPRKLRVNGQEFRIDSWAQCDRCSVWRRVKEDYHSSKFYCGLAGKHCHQKEKYHKDMILL